ncbi:MAG: hypothetical protein MUF51_06910, partial [Vicinamibacteria bacterium]|nr:hypothetical protein [Vicinamibacteria bacterium]
PAIRYEKGKDGLITPLSELVLRQLGPAMLLLREPRKDFVLVTQAKVSLWQNDQMYIAGLLRGDAAGLTIQEAAGQKTAALKLAVTAVDGEGQRVMASERDVVATVGADNWFLSSYAAQLKPGSYTMNVALIDPVTKKGNVSSLPVFVPTPPANELMLTDLFILSGIREEQTANPKDPLWAFFLGSATLLPRFGNVYTRQDQIQFLAIGYNAPVNPATGAPATSARFVVTKDGQVKTQSPEQSYTTASIMPEAGPVPLEKFEPGFYKVMLAVTDQVTKKTYKKEATFEVKP